MGRELRDQSRQDWRQRANQARVRVTRAAPPLRDDMPRCAHCGNQNEGTAVTCCSCGELVAIPRTTDLGTPAFLPVRGLANGHGRSGELGVGLVERNPLSHTPASCGHTPTDPDPDVPLPDLGLDAVGRLLHGSSMQFSADVHGGPNVEAGSMADIEAGADVMQRRQMSLREKALMIVLVTFPACSVWARVSGHALKASATSETPKVFLFLVIGTQVS
eukprot:SAG31_NODE_17152_length_681_cov_1.242268_1_plen_217_part_01